MVNFHLHTYATTDSAFNGMVAPHKYRFAAQRGIQTKDYVSAWRRDKKRIIQNFLDKMNEIYDNSDKVFLFAPLSIIRIFIDDIIEGIINDFPNFIDLTNAFSKKEYISFGNSTYADYTLDELSEFIDIDKGLLGQIINPIDKLFIVDDVYASGKSIALTKHLIRNNLDLGEDVEVKSGVVLLMP